VLLHHWLSLWNKRHGSLLVGGGLYYVVEGPLRRECMREGANTPLAEGRAKETGVVRIGLLGGFSVTVGDRKVDESAWRLRKAASLIKLLALAPGHRLHRERAMDLLWPESGKKAASNNLRQTLHVARRTLHPDRKIASRYLSLSGEQLVMCPHEQLWVDVDAFEQAADTARRSEDPAAYRAAIELYPGELLPEDRYEEWAESRRQELRQRFLSLLVELARLYEERGGEGLTSAVQALQRVLAEEPTNEEAHVGLMRLYALSGRHGEALRQYGRLSEALSSGLGVEPSASTRALREEIAAGRFQAGPTQGAGSPTEPPGEPTRETSGGGGAQAHNLPAHRTSFVGREREMLDVKRALAMTRLLTLTGAGGSGKTRLALEVARDLVGAYPDGVWLVELAPLTEGKLVPHAVADALGVPEGPDRSLSDALVDALREKRLLLVLDNCEHLIEAAAQLSDALLSSCPLLRVVATSRETLGVEGELVWQVEPLSFPDVHRDDDRDAHRAPAPGELERYEAVRLFVERARLRSSHFELRTENAEAVAQICRSLEGIPLAVELAAARVRALSLEQIAERLKDSLKLLRGDSRTATLRQRTLRGTLNWSHELLSAKERELLRRLSAFAGGWTLEAAEAVGASDGIQEEEVLDLLSNLVDKSLVVAEVMAGEVGCYRLLETVRQYARERLEASGEADAFLRRHAKFFLALAEEAEPGLAGAQQQDWAKRLEEEHDNMRSALSWSLEREPETALRLAVALARFWEIRSHHLEGSRWIEVALRRSDHADGSARAKALSEAGTFAWHRGDYQQATVFHGEALALYRDLGEEGNAAFALLCLGVQDLEQGEHERARPFFEEALALSRELGDKRNIVYALHNLAEVARHTGHYEQARALGMEAVSVSQEMDDKWTVARDFVWLGMVTAYKSDDYEEAAGFLEEGFALIREVGDWEYVAYALDSFAVLAGAKAQGERAARLWGAAEALRKSIGTPLHPTERPDYDRSVVAARSQLNEAAWEAAFAQGMAMSGEEAAEYALSEEVAPAAPESPPAEGRTVEPLTTLLTAREREVAAMVAQGMSNRQIAQELFLSEHTVKRHISKILRKLGLASRAEVAAWATERLLLTPPFE
jgi:predicted ATPase/DNA-binding SARP family transcriptional activator/DNA-binding CsgD family transcriptional regulator